MATIHCLVTHILLIIFFCVQKNKELRTGLDQIEAKLRQNYNFGMNCPFKNIMMQLFNIVFFNITNMFTVTYLYQLNVSIKIKKYHWPQSFEIRHKYKNKINVCI